MAIIKKEEVAAKDLEHDLQGILDAYIMADVNDDELSVTIISNGEGWRAFISNVKELMGTGLGRAELLDAVHGRYTMEKLLDSVEV